MRRPEAKGTIVNYSCLLVSFISTAPSSEQDPNPPNSPGFGMFPPGHFSCEPLQQFDTVDRSFCSQWCTTDEADAGALQTSPGSPSRCLGVSGYERQHQGSRPWSQTIACCVLQSSGFTCSSNRASDLTTGMTSLRLLPNRTRYIGAGGMPPNSRTVIQSDGHR